MTDYYSLIARAVEGLDTSTGEARWAVYERARKAVEQLRSTSPPSWKQTSPRSASPLKGRSAR
jgi:hypothetical protein